MAAGPRARRRGRPPQGPRPRRVGLERRRPGVRSERRRGPRPARARRAAGRASSGPVPQTTGPGTPGRVCADPRTPSGSPSSRCRRRGRTSRRRPRWAPPLDQRRRTCPPRRTSWIRASPSADGGRDGRARRSGPRQVPGRQSPPRSLRQPRRHPSPGVRLPRALNLRFPRVVGAPIRCRAAVASRGRRRARRSPGENLRRAGPAGPAAGRWTGTGRSGRRLSRRSGQASRRPPGSPGTGPGIPHPHRGGSASPATGTRASPRRWTRPAARRARDTDPPWTSRSGSRLARRRQPTSSPTGTRSNAGIVSAAIFPCGSSWTGR